MASFAGSSLGFVFSMPVMANPKGRQVNVYPGANGLEVIDLGTRGGRTVVEGAFGASTAYGLSLYEGSMRLLQIDGSPYTLVDTLGASWLNVILVMFEPVGRVYAGGPGLARRYRAEFLHVS